MQISIRQIVFVIAGLIIVGFSFFWGKLNIVQASVKDGQIFGEWKASCNLDNNKKQICLLSQQYKSSQKDNDNTLAIYQFVYSGAGKDQKLMMIQILPLGVLLPPGTSIINGEKIIVSGKFSVCNSAGCNAVAEISPQDLETILANNNNFLGFIGPEGKQINFPISINGLKAGLAALRK